MKIGQRIEKILEDLELSSGTFADEIGVQRSTISHILSGRNKPSIDFLEKLLNKFPGIDAGWLLTGVATKRNGVSQVGEVKQEKTIEKVVIFFNDGTFKDCEPKKQV